MNSTPLLVVLAIVGGSLAARGAHRMVAPDRYLVDDFHLTFAATEAEREGLESAVRAWGALYLVVGGILVAAAAASRFRALTPPSTAPDGGVPHPTPGAPPPGAPLGRLT